MAGTARPNDSLLTGVEMTDYEIIDSKISNGSVNGLFDEIIIRGSWNSSDVCYWGEPGNYVTIKFNKPCLIWRHDGGDGNNKLFTIYEVKDDGTEIDVTKQIAQYELTSNFVWQKAIYIEMKGTYKFVFTGARIDTEWFLETTDIYYNATFLDENNNQISTIKYKEQTPVDINTFPMFQENKVFVGFQKPDGTLFKNGEVITEDLTLTPLFVDYEPITDSSDNIVAVKLKDEIYNMLRKAIEKYAITQEE